MLPTERIAHLSYGRRLLRCGISIQLMSQMGLGCAKTPAVAPHVEISAGNCIPESQIILHTAKFDALLENCVFYILRMYEFLHRVGHNRKGSQRAYSVRITPKSRHRRCALALPICADFVAEVADERGKLRLGAELPLAPLKRWL